MIKDLINKMDSEGLLGVVVLKNWLVELQKCTTICQGLCDNNMSFTTTSEYVKANELYENIRGFLWGLYTVNYISDELRDEYVDELIKNYAF